MGDAAASGATPAMAARTSTPARRVALPAASWPIPPNWRPRGAPARAPARTKRRREDASQVDARASLRRCRWPGKEVDGAGVSRRRRFPVPRRAANEFDSVSRCQRAIEGSSNGASTLTRSGAGLPRRA